MTFLSPVVSQATTVDLIVRFCGVPKIAIYRHFPSKEDLALAVLQLRAQRYTVEWLDGETKRRTTKPDERLLELFDLHDEWFQKPDFDGCIFLRTLMESRPGSRLYEATQQHLMQIKALIADFATAAGLSNPEDFAAEWQTLLSGSIVSAWGGDRGAARKAKRIAEIVLQQAVTCGAGASRGIAERLP